MTQSGPWLCLNQMVGLHATNTLYTFTFNKKLTFEQKAAWALSFLSRHTFQTMTSKGRNYASRLRKYEPGDLLSLPIIGPKRFKGAAKQYVLAIRSLLKGDAPKARKIADNFLGLGRVRKP